MYASGKVLRKLIAEHDTSQAAIARATGIKKQNISLICNGKTQYPSIHTCKLIAGFFGLTLDVLSVMCTACPVVLLPAVFARSRTGFAEIGTR